MIRIMATLLLSICLLVSYSSVANNESGMLGLRTAVYKVNDIQKATLWYSEVFSRSAYYNQPYYVGFNIDGFELGLMPDTQNTQRASNVIAYWGVTNIDTEYQRLIQLGAVADTPIADVGGGIRLGTVKDPFGNILGLIYNPLFTPKEQQH